MEVIDLYICIKVWKIDAPIFLSCFRGQNCDYANKMVLLGNKSSILNALKFAHSHNYVMVL